MELTPEQNEAVAKWVLEGLRLSEVQKRLSQEFNVSMTYMAVRFLVDDLELALKDRPDRVSAVVELNSPGSGAGPGAPRPAAGASDLSGGGSVQVEIDSVIKPGAVVCGSVVFSGGKRAEWTIDAIGRLGLEPSTPGFQPSPDDIQEFQDELQLLLRKRGY